MSQDRFVHLLLRQSHDSSFVPQLQPVLDRPEPPISDRETCLVLFGQVPTGRQGARCVEGCGTTDRLVEATVNELQKLHRELDIPDASPSQFYVGELYVRRMGTCSSGARTPSLTLDSLFDGANRRDPLRRNARRVNQGARLVHERLPHGMITPRSAGLD